MKITNIQWGDIHHWDYPDYCDAFIESCLIDGIEATEAQLDELNEDRDLTHELLWEHLC